MKDVTVWTFLINVAPNAYFLDCSCRNYHYSVFLTHTSWQVTELKTSFSRAAILSTMQSEIGYIAYRRNVRLLLIQNNR